MGKVFALKNMKNNLKFFKQWAKKDLQIYYNWHRYYSAKLGRYYKFDPISKIFSCSTFMYGEVGIKNMLYFYLPLKQYKDGL